MGRKGMVFTGMGFELVGLVLGALYIGGIIDRHYQLPGYGTAGMIILCTVGWIWHIIVLLNNIMKSDDGDSEGNVQ